jgi:hypothetical protein
MADVAEVVIDNLGVLYAHQPCGTADPVKTPDLFASGVTTT